MKYLYTYDEYYKRNFKAVSVALKLAKKNYMTGKDFQDLIKAISESMFLEPEESESMLVSMTPEELQDMFEEKLDRHYEYLFMELQTATC